MNRVAASALVLSIFALSGCATAVQAAPPTLTRIAIIGDSISQGGNATRGTRAYAHRLGVLRPDLMVYNYSRWGWKVSAPNRAYFAGPAQIATEAVLIALGTNDYGFSTPLEQFREDFRGAIRFVRITEATPVYVLTPLWRAGCDKPNLIGATLADYRQIELEECAAAPRCVALDGDDAVPHELRFFADGLHPNDRGHKRIALFLAKRIGH